MEILILVVVLLAVFNLYSRVLKIEQVIKKDSVLPTSQSIQQPTQSIGEGLPVVLGPLLEYIRQQLAQGVDREKIKNTLLVSDWKEVDIEKAFSALAAGGKVSVPTLSSHATNQTQDDLFIKWIKEDWLLKLGAFFLLLGFGWLTTYAFMNDWIGPMGRIMFGIIAGVLIMVVGWWRMQKYVHQGSVFLVLGSTTVLLTIFAAREIYHFFTPSAALAIMFLSTAFVALASVKYTSKSLALASLILAGIAPLFTSSPSPDYIGLFAYLLVVILGAIWIVAITGMRELTTAALALVAVYSLPHIFDQTSPDVETLLLFAYAFAGLFFLTSTASILKMRKQDIAPNLITAAGNGFLLLAWIMMVAPKEWQSLIISAWMVVFAAGAFLIVKATQRREPFYAYASVCIAMLAAATSAELSGTTLTIAYTVEVVAIIVIAYAMLKDIAVAKRLSLLFVVPVTLSLGSIDSYAWDTGVLHKDFFVLFLLAGAFLFLFSFFSVQTRGVKDEEVQQYNSTLLTIGSVYVYVLLWLSLHAGLDDKNTATMISLMVYTIIGIAAYFYGLKNDTKGFRLYGGVLIGFVVVRLLLIDIWLMEMGVRIVTFFLMGALLMSTAFLGKKKQVQSASNQTYSS
ncbi:MAG: DUF2339 domain-containing protein [bacterium]|nr:DUF2339 domain-containing protein [bacterium]